ncbi:MAG: restriction endonuclease [Pseudohongiella sp.]|nr:restriction endonuclease [Pseudohongiella sp.]
MARRNDNILEQLIHLPWWVSVITSATVYIAMTVVIPGLVSQSPLLSAVAQALPKLAPWFALLFLLPAPISWFISRKKRLRLDAQRDVDTIKALSWRAFEQLVAEAFRRQGYTVEENATAGADGGIDIRLVRDGELHIVQCKQWRAQKVGVSIVREMYGILIAENANQVSVITSGTFTQEAKAFAANKPIDLIDGPALLQLIESVQHHHYPSFESAEPASPFRTPAEFADSISQDTCPQCGASLVTRVAKKGSNAGGQFIGCSAFPKCRFTRQV